MPTRKVVWVADVSAGSSPEESACFAIELGGQHFGTATVFKVDGEFVDIEGDEPSNNRACYDDIVILTPMQLAKVFNEWQRRYKEEPEAFESSWASMKRFIAEEEAGEEPSLGVGNAEYAMSIAKDLGFA